MLKLKLKSGPGAGRRGGARVSTVDRARSPYYYILLHPVARRRLLLRAGGGGWKGGYFKHGRWGEGSSKRVQEGKRNCYTELKLRVC